VFGYARRQCDLASAQDVVSDTFLVAWRRRDVVPDPALPWLLVVARNTIANRRRYERRQDHLVDTVARLERVAAGADHGVGERDAMLRSLAGLSAVEREAVLLVAWDGLANRAAAAGCSVRAFEVRLSRGRGPCPPRHEYRDRPHRRLHRRETGHVISIPDRYTPEGVLDVVAGYAPTTATRALEWNPSREAVADDPWVLTGRPAGVELMINEAVVTKLPSSLRHCPNG